MSGMTKAERLAEMKRLYIQRAYSDLEMAQRLGADRTTIYRDRIELIGEYPVEPDEEGRYHIPRSKLISEIKVNLHEALTLYLAARKTSRQTRFHNPHAANAVEKLAATLRQPMTEKLLKAADVVLKQDKDPERIKIIEIITQAWVEQRKVRIRYQRLESKDFVNHIIHPYLIEPSIWSDSVYVIAFSEVTEGLIPFKIDRIESASILPGEGFEIPADFDEQELLKHAWGIWVGDKEPVTVKLRFSPAVTKRVKESIWHPLEKVEDTEDGGCLWSADVAEWREMLPWVRGWGADVEVLEPEGLKNNLKLEIQTLAQLYSIMDNPSKNASNSIEERILLLWGKTQKGSLDPNDYHPALFHMLDVALVAKTLLGNDASPRWRNSLGKVLGVTPGSLQDWLPWFIALHDIGKISVPFQEQNNLQKSRLIAEGFDLGNKRWNNNPPHALISQVFIRHESDFSFAEKLLSGLADLAGGHHGWFSDTQAQRDARDALRKEPEAWKEYRCETSKLLFEILNTKLPSNLEDINVSAVGMTLTGFCILCDWLGSDSEVFKIAAHKSLDRYIPESMERAKSVVERAGFFHNSRSEAGNKFQELFPNITPRPLQIAIDEIPESVLSNPCLAIIEAPTGEGKTEAALALAHRIAQFNDTDEFYYALPTTATSNQMFGRLQEYLLKRLNLPTQINLIHGQAFLYQDDLRIQPLGNGNQDEDDAIDWFAPKKRALLAPFGVGTVDQAELAALNVKHLPLRMMGLAGKVLIIDEVHAYDTYMTTVIEMLLRWLSQVGTSVILLSATLPKERRARLAEAYGVEITEKMRQSDSYPSLWIVSKETAYQANPPAQQPVRSISLDISLNYSDDQVEEKARWLLKAVTSGGCVCWMTNTVARAQQIFDAVDKAALDKVERFLLHAQLPLDERQKREKEITEKFGPASTDRKPSIVIGTQVLEQSLDLDFDVMVSDIGPIDLLLQRAGRLHRHIGRERPAVHAEPRFYINAERSDNGELSLGVNGYVYAPYILHRSWEALQNRSEINLPADYRPLIEFVYDEKEPEPDHPLRSAWDKLQKEQNNAVEQAQQRIVPSPHPNDSFSGPISQLRFKESETQAGWMIAKTRLGEESITIIPLERRGDVCKVRVDEEDVEFNVKQEISHDLQIKLLRRSIRVSNMRGVQVLKSRMNELSPVFKDASLLKDALPLFLTESNVSFPFEKGNITFLLDPKLGLVIDFKKGA